MTWSSLVSSVCGMYMFQGLDTFIEKISLEQEIEKEIVLGVIHTESRCKQDVVGSVGELGLMQITPRWHMERAKKLGVSDLADPYSNILVGANLLKDLGINENPENALRIYNGGYVPSEHSKRYALDVMTKAASYKSMLEI